MKTRLSVAFLVATLVPLIIATGVLAWLSQRSATERAEESAQQAAVRGARTLEDLSDAMHYQLLLAADNTAFREFLTNPVAKKSAKADIDRALVHLNELQPNLIDEACFIATTGPELARMVKGRTAEDSDLSADESDAPFFADASAAGAGDVVQTLPYVSGDTDRWVIANVTPVVFTNGKPAAMVHFEVAVEGIRQKLAEAMGKGIRARVVDTATGNTVFDTGGPEVAKAPFASSAFTQDGTASASTAITVNPGNKNTWKIETLAPVTPAFTGRFWLAILTVAALSLALVGIIARRFTQRLISRIDNVRVGLSRLAKGELSEPITDDGTDEIAEMAETANQARVHLRESLQRITADSKTLHERSRQLTALGANVLDRMNTAKDSSIRMRASAGELLTQVGETSAGAQAVDASLNMVAHQAQSVSAVGAEAVEAAESTDRTVTQLGAATDEIGGIVALIESIATQTRLLALNATIEAARAGSAGRGFAVVASEVGTLAAKTSGATSQVTSQIEAVRKGVEEATSGIRNITGVVERVRDAQVGISQAIVDQRPTLTQLSNGAHSATAQVNAAEALSRRIEEDATRAASAAEEVAMAGQELDRVAASLKAMVEEYTL